ncbi:MAG: histidine phosphatase family protein [Clostridiales bacterium]|nr:histidine phosphatase family protein [Clostridiales bacterium]
MTFYLIRHGETDWNRQNRLQGIEDIELNGTGVSQSYGCARAFRNIPVDRILTSPLKRAKATAEIMAETLNAGPVIVEQDLTERDFGKLSGLRYEDRETLFARNEDPCMEPRENVIERFMNVLYRYLDAEAADSIVVVSHGASINVILSHLSGGDIGTGKTILKNTCISKLSCIGREFTIELYNLSPDEFFKTT